MPLQPVVPAASADGTGTVTGITDGDTLRLDVDGVELRVRLVGIDTPEVYPDVECFGPEAEDALAAFAPRVLELAAAGGDRAASLAAVAAQDLAKSVQLLARVDGVWHERGVAVRHEHVPILLRQLAEELDVRAGCLERRSRGPGRALAPGRQRPVPP